jgi:hypothetical protein
MPVEDITRDLEDGVRLINFLELLTEIVNFFKLYLISSFFRTSTSNMIPNQLQGSISFHFPSLSSKTILNFSLEFIKYKIYIKF